MTWTPPAQRDTLPIHPTRKEDAVTPQQARQAIKDTCTAKGWNVMDLARHSQVSPEAIRRYINSTGEISTQVVFRLLKALGIDPNSRR